MQFGYRKTSMDDIARGAGMSRTALYLHFKNKEDICRSLVRFYYAQKCALVEDALGRPGAVEEVLTKAVSAHMGELLNEVKQSPRGAELIDVVIQIAASDVEAGEARILGLYRDWLARCAESGDLRTDIAPEELARALVSALKGAKAQRNAAPNLCTSLENLAKVIGRGLTK